MYGEILYMKICVFLFLRHFTEFYGICMYPGNFFMRMHVLHFFVVILRNSTEFTFMKRFFMRMRVLPFLRNYGEILCDSDRFILFLHVIILRNSTKFAFMKRFFFMRMHVLHFFVVILRNSTEFTFMKRFFMRMRVLPFLRNYGEILCDNDRFILFLHVIILRNSTKFAFMKRFFFMRMHVFPFFYGILRNSAELAFMGRFLMRMHVLHFLRNSTEFNGI